MIIIMISLFHLQNSSKYIHMILLLKFFSFWFMFQPDITAPGVNVLAAYSEAVSPTDIESDKRRVPYNIVSGTSMSCPHVSGIVGLFKTLHPDWSPAAIKSAIMTSGNTHYHISFMYQFMNLDPLKCNIHCNLCSLERENESPIHFIILGLTLSLCTSSYLSLNCTNCPQILQISLFISLTYRNLFKFQLPL